VGNRVHVNEKFLYSRGAHSLYALESVRAAVKSPRMRALASIWSWFAIVLVIIVCFLVQLPLWLVTAPFDRNRMISGRWFRFMAVVAVKMIPSWNFGVVGQAPSPMNPRTVVISNHASHADTFLISHVPWEMKWMGKSSLFKIPFLGWSMWLSGDIPVTRGNRDSVGSAMKLCAAKLERGVPVIIFPEGTRSSTGELGPFKDGAFRLAIETHADVLPLAVQGTRDALPKHSMKFGKVRARVAIGTPISTAGMSLEDVERLKGIARAQIEALLAQLRGPQGSAALAAPSLS